MCLRYSSSVVAPTARSSPRASIGFKRLAASTAPSAAPAPTIVCSSSRNRMIRPSAVGDLLEHGLEPVLELAAVLGAGDQRTDVERDHAPVAQRVGDVARDDPLRQALDDRGLADAGLADQHGVVLRAPREHLDHAPDLVVAADDRVELAGFGGLGEVAAEALERLELLLGVLVGHAMRPAHRVDRPGELVAWWRRRRPSGRPRAPAAGARSRRTRRPSRARSRRPRAAGRRGRDRGRPRGRVSAADGRKGVERLVGAPADPLGIDVGAAQHGHDDAAVLLEQRDQHVLGQDLGIATSARQALGRGERLLGHRREAI